MSTPLVKWGQLWIVVDISVYQSQQSGVVICAIMRKSQRANHANMEIQNIRTISHNATGYLSPGSLLRKGIKPQRMELVIDC